MAEHPPQSARMDWDHVLRELEEKHGFHHLDVDGSDRGASLQNPMIIRDNSGGVRPIIIDLEEFELTRPTRGRTK